MAERDLQEAHARILRLEEELEQVREQHRRAREHSRLWEKRAKQSHRRLQRVLDVMVKL